MFSKTSLLLSSILLFQFATQCKTQSTTSISGNVTMQEGWKPVLYLLQPPGFKDIGVSYTGLVVDSAVIDGAGNFQFNLAQKLPADEMLLFVCIQKKGSKFKNQLLDDNPLLANYMPLIVKNGETIQFSSVAGSFQAAFQFKNPSVTNQSLIHLKEIRLAGFQQHIAPLATQAHDESALLQEDEARKQFKAPLVYFTDTVSEFLPAIVAVRWVNPDTDYEREPELLVQQCDKWKNAQHPYQAQLCALANREHLPVLLGDLIPNEWMPMVQGDSVRLNRLFGNKLTILDIWASWCAPCRKENRDVLAPIWAEYSDQGLNIIGYSIDSSPGAWKAAISKDVASWAHASHLTGDATPFMEALRISTIPANFLVDKDGKVVAKNLHGEALKIFVDAWMKTH